MRKNTQLERLWKDFDKGKKIKTRKEFNEKVIENFTGERPYKRSSKIVIATKIGPMTPKGLRIEWSNGSISFEKKKIT